MIQVGDTVGYSHAWLKSVQADADVANARKPVLCRTAQPSR